MNKLAEIHAQDEKLLGCAASDIVQNLPQRLSHTILAWSEKTPQQLALVGDRESLTYAELAVQIEWHKQFLIRQRVRPGDRVMLVGENGISLMCLLLALSELDGLAVIANARLSDRELDLIHMDCEPRQVIFISADSLDAEKHGIRKEAHEESLPFGDVLVSDIAEVEPEKAGEDPVNQVLAMIYTTGTTGTPKGVMLTHRNLSFIAYVSGRLRGVKQGDKVYCVLPMSHVFGLSALSCSVLTVGGCVYLRPRFDAKRVLKELVEEDIVGFFGVPTMYALMLEVIAKDYDQNVFKPRALRFMYSGGAPLDLNLKNRVKDAFSLPLNNGYGLTETGPTICQTRQYAPIENTSVGYCLPGVSIEIRDEQGAAVQQGQVGELWVQGPNVMKGYFRKPEVTAEVIKDGWFNTADLVFEDEHGTINIAGRSKELIIRSGFNIYPPEVEAVLNGHPQVSLSAVVGRMEKGDEIVCAFIQPVAGTKVDVADLLSYAKQYLAGYKVPGEVHVLDALPAASSGKILKHKLKDYLT